MNESTTKDKLKKLTDILNSQGLDGAEAYLDDNKADKDFVPLAKIVLRLRRELGDGFDGPAGVFAPA